MCYVMGYVQYCYVTVDNVWLRMYCLLLLWLSRHLWRTTETKTNFPERDNKVYRMVYIPCPIRRVCLTRDDDLLFALGLAYPAWTRLRLFVGLSNWANRLFFLGSVETRPIITAQWSSIRLIFWLELLGQARWFTSKCQNKNRKCY